MTNNYPYLETKLEREKVAQGFVDSLPIKPALWYIGGSTARGDFRPDSDIDIHALFEHDVDIPFMTKRELGIIDFHSYAKDWPVYQNDPKLLAQWEILIEGKLP